MSTGTGPLEISALKVSEITAARIPDIRILDIYNKTECTLDELEASDVCQFLDYLHSLFFLTLWQVLVISH
jgi:hypothetical protein